MKEPERRLAVLAFHKIGPPPAGAWETWFYIPDATFAAHLAYLHDHGWEVIDLPTFLAGLAAPETLPARTALLTFDDGYRSIFNAALPTLRRFGYPAVLFVPTAFIGGRNVFDGGAEPDEDICGWEDLAELERQGVRVQSHGVTHRAFSELAAAERDHELRWSRAALESRLGTAVDIFCYPFGDNGGDPAAARAALERAGYRAAVLYGGGVARVPILDPYSIQRVAMGADTDLRAALGDP